MHNLRTCLNTLVFGALAGFAACHPSEPYLQLPPTPPGGAKTHVQIVHFSDYHSHAVPYFSEHQANQAGIARAVSYINQLKATDKDLIVLNGGDMWNTGTPAWSDRYYKDCTEWRYLSDLTTAMAFGNHDVDYGWDAFLNCAKQVSHPVISGNLVDGTGAPILTASGKPYVIKQIGALRIGLFALAGPDFVKLVKTTNLPPSGASFSDSLTAAKGIVKALRETEKVDAVVFFGHQDRESDYAMAKQVPGIDLILGTHSHYKGEFEKIAGTQTFFISPFQYLNYLSQVDLEFLDGRLNAVSGKLVRLAAELPEDSQIAREVGMLQKDLEADPMYAPRFQVIGQAAVELDLGNIDRGESVLGNFAMDTVRTVVPAHAAFSTASSFRASIPPGPIRMEDYLTALPYKNKILALSMTGEQVQAILEYGVSKLGSDNFAVSSGVRYTIKSGKVANIGIAKDPSARVAEYEPLLPLGTYTIMTNDYMANIAAGYKDIFGKAASSMDTGRIVNDEVIAYIKAKSPVSARIEGRVTTGN